MSSGFRLEFGYVPDPDNGLGATPEESSSWGWFQFWAGDVNLCEHTVAGSVEDRVYWYLLPMLEWFTANWDSLFHEFRLPEAFRRAVSARDGYWSVCPFDLDEVSREQMLAWRNRHCIRAAANGGVFPDVFMRRSLDDVEIAWGHADVTGAPHVRFQARRGRSLFPAKQTAIRLHETLGRAIAEIAKKEPSSARVRALAKAHALLEKPRSVERSAWMVSAGANIAESTQKIGLWLGKAKDSAKKYLVPPQTPLLIEHAPPAALMFGSLSPSISESDVQNLLEILGKAAAAPPAKLPEIDSEETRIDSAWEQGYELARRARECLHLGNEPYTDIDLVLDERKVAVYDAGLSDDKIRAVAIRGKGLAPCIALNTKYRQNARQNARRFTLAHELCHLMVDRKRGVPLAIASGPWAPEDIEKRANAFAAMFLMPGDVTQKLFNEYSREGKLTCDGVASIATDLGTSWTATLEHLRNLGLIDDEEKDGLNAERDEAPRPQPLPNRGKKP